MFGDEQGGYSQRSHSSEDTHPRCLNTERKIEKRRGQRSSGSEVRGSVQSLTITRETLRVKPAGDS